MSSKLPSACLLRPRAVSFSAAAAATTTTPSMIMLASSPSSSPLPSSAFLGRRSASPHQQQQVRHAAEVMRPRRPYMFTQLVQLSDGSAFTVRTTMPTGYYRSDRDSRNNLRWQPNDKTLSAIEMDEAGKLASFRSRYGRGWDQQHPLQQAAAVAAAAAATETTITTTGVGTTGGVAPAPTPTPTPTPASSAAAAAAAAAQAAEAEAKRAEEAAAGAKSGIGAAEDQQTAEKGSAKKKNKKTKAKEAGGAAASREPAGGDPFSSLVDLISMYGKQDDKAMRGLTLRESKKKATKK